MSLAQTVFLEHLILQLLLCGVQNNLRQLQLARINNSETKSICSSILFVKRINKDYFRLSLRIYHRLSNVVLQCDILPTINHIINSALHYQR